MIKAGDYEENIIDPDDPDCPDGRNEENIDDKIPWKPIILPFVLTLKTVQHRAHLVSASWIKNKQKILTMMIILTSLPIMVMKRYMMRDFDQNFDDNNENVETCSAVL